MIFSESLFCLGRGSVPALSSQNLKGVETRCLAVCPSMRCRAIEFALETILSQGPIIFSHILWKSPCVEYVCSATGVRHPCDGRLTRPIRPQKSEDSGAPGSDMCPDYHPVLSLDPCDSVQAWQHDNVTSTHIVALILFVFILMRYFWTRLKAWQGVYTLHACCHAFSAIFVSRKGKKSTTTRQSKVLCNISN